MNINNRFPAHIEIEVTNKCMLSCAFCPHRFMKREQGLMPVEVIQKIATQVKHRAKTCYLHQIGEPLLHPYIDSYILFMHTAGVRTSISTNAVLLDEITCMRLFSCGLDELTIALDSLNPETYSKLRRGGNFERVIKNTDKCISLRKAFGRGPQIELQVIVTKENVSEITAIKEKYDPMIQGVGRLLFKGFSTFGGRIQDMAPVSTEPRRFTCSKLNNSIAIHWNGDMSLCCRDYDGEQVVGNILTDTIEDVFNSEEYDKLRKNHKAHAWFTDPRLALCANC